MSYKRWTLAELNRVNTLRLTGMPWADIDVQLERDEGDSYNAARRYNMGCLTEEERKTIHSKQREQRDAKILKLIDRGETDAAIATEFDISPELVRGIRKRNGRQPSIEILRQLAQKGLAYET